MGGMAEESSNISSRLRNGGAKSIFGEETSKKMKTSALRAEHFNADIGYDKDKQKYKAVHAKIIHGDGFTGQHDPRIVFRNLTLIKVRTMPGMI